MSAFDLTGRTALVTGAARGLGEAMAIALAGQEATVIIADILDDAAQATAKRLTDAGHKASAIHLDVADEASWEAAIQELAQDGGFDILVNNAGVEIADLVTDLKVEEMQKMVTVNIIGTALGMKHGLRAMRPGGSAGRGGSIINISSVAATIAFPGIAIYSACKSAIDRMTRVAAAEAGKLEYGVRVNCIYPGLVPTEMGSQLAVECANMGLFASPEAAVGAVSELTPLGRLGTPEEMADAVVFLASDASRFVTGIGLPVDGGMGS